MVLQPVAPPPTGTQLTSVYALRGAFSAAAVRYGFMYAAAPPETGVAAGPVPDHGPDATSLYPERRLEAVR
jgi:hypothetical protein